MGILFINDKLGVNPYSLRDENLNFLADEEYHILYDLGEDDEP